MPVGVAIALSLVLVATLVLLSIRHHFMAQDLDELKVISRSIEAVLQTTGLDHAQLSERLSHAVAGHHGVFYQVQDSEGTLIFQTAGIDFAAPTTAIRAASELSQDNLRVWTSAGQSYRGVVTTLSRGATDYRVVAAIDMNFHSQFLSAFKRSLWLIMLGTGGVTLLAAWLGIHRGHLPLRGLSDSMQEVRTNRLNLRIDPDGVPQELRELVVSFNDMIGRLEEGFERLSHFSSDIAHELRTPLTNLITQTQVTLSKPRDSDAYLELLYSSLEEQERLAKMISDMLWLAKSDNALIEPILEPIDLAVEFHSLFDFFEALAAESGIEFSLHGGAPIVYGDRPLLQRGFSNLISNALRYSPTGSTVSIQLAELSSQGAVRISITNEGPAIPQERLPRLFDRFYRVDPSRQRNSDGVGLGLAITRSIVEAHGGKISVTSDQSSTSFVIQLPIAV